MPDPILHDAGGLTDEDRAALKVKRIENAGQFWSRMAGDQKLIDSLGLPDDQAKERVVEVMSRFAEKRADSITQNALIVHIPDMIVAVLLCLIAYSLFFLDRTPPRPEMARQVVVVAAEGIAPFHVIRSSDVEIRDSIKSPSALTAVDAVIGRYTTEHVTPGSVISKSQLSAGRPLSKELDGLRVFSVKLQPSPILTNLKVPAKLAIVPSPRARDKAIKPKLYELYVLESRPQSAGVSAVIAATPADSRELASLLGHADLIAVGPAR